MKALEQNSASAAVICPICQGSGQDGKRACANCVGLGAIVVDDGRFAYWGRPVDSFHVTVRRLRRVIDAVINGIAFICALGGLVALIALVVFNAKPADLLHWSFWWQPHKYLVASWFGLLWGCFAYYRMSVVAAGRQPIVPQRYQKADQPVEQPPADLWAWVRRLSRRKRQDIASVLSTDAERLVEEAFVLARSYRHAGVGPIHLFAMAFTNRTGQVVRARLGLNVETVTAALRGLLTRETVGGVEPEFHSAVPTIMAAYRGARAARQTAVRTGDIMIAALEAEPRLVDMLVEVGSSRDQLANVIAWQRVQERLRERRQRFTSAARLKPKSDVNRSMTAVATPFLDRLSRDLTREAAAGMFLPIVERDREFVSLLRAIEGGGRSVIIVGQPGVGKDAMLEGLAELMVEEQVPEILQDKRLVLLDIGRVVAGATPAEAQERLLIGLSEVAQAGNIVLAVANVGAMVGISAGSGDSLDLAQVFANELARGYFFAVTTATPREFTEAIEGTPLANVLTRVDLAEPDENAAIRMLEAQAGFIEYQQGVWFSYGALETAVRLSSRHLHDQFLPQKAIEIAREAGQAARQRAGKATVISAEDVAGIIAEKTGIPLKAIAEDESEKLLNLEGHLHGRVIGQDGAVRAIAAAMRRARAGMRDQSRPIANFLFLGPTGVGKTELAKSLADAYFGSEQAMIRLDMSEYQSADSVARLIGAPGGEAGQLSEAVRRKPFSLVLLDEIEKADPNILNIFLQVMDDGRLTDNQGRVVDFTSAIIIATSNAGAQFIQDEVRQGTELAKIREGLLNQELKGHFRPEFLNRFDEIIVFAPLDREQTLAIARLMLRKVTQRLEDQGVVFEITDAALNELADAGYDPAFGARPLRRVIQDRVDSAIAQAMLEKKFKRGQRVIYDVGGVLKYD